MLHNFFLILDEDVGKGGEDEEELEMDGNDKMQAGKYNIKSILVQQAWCLEYYFPKYSNVRIHLPSTNECIMKIANYQSTFVWVLVRFCFAWRAIQIDLVTRIEIEQ